MDFQCEIKEQAEQPTLSIRTRTPIEGLPQLLSESYGKIAGYLAELGEEPSGRGLLQHGYAEPGRGDRLSRGKAIRRRRRHPGQ